MTMSQVVTADLRGDVAPVLCVGEAMVAFAPVAGGLSSGGRLVSFVAGAEANVATTLAHLGEQVEWFGYVGSDPFGVLISTTLQGRGVDTRHVVIHPGRPTGIYFKDRAGSASTMYYYRSGSAASDMHATDVDALRLDERQLVHLSGITPALSAGCDTFVTAAVDRARDATVSFDINFRSKLWPASVAAPKLKAIAQRADIVITGRDEAHELWGTDSPADIRELFPEVDTVVVKDADIGATEFSGDQECFVPAPRVEVVEPIGAGDAFAAGYLRGYLSGAASDVRLRLGHVTAAHTLGAVSDSPDLPEVALLRSFAELNSAEWAALSFPARS